MKTKVKYFVLIAVSIVFTVWSCKEEIVYPDLKIAKSEVTLTEGDIQQVAITSGSGQYTAISSDKSKATVTIANNTVVIKAISAGAVKIMVNDGKNGQTKNIAVTVEAKIVDLAIDKDKITLEAGKQATFAITAGSGTYTVESSDKEKATAVIDKNTITISGVAEGTVKITVTDSKTKQTKMVTVTVEAKTADLAIDKDKISLEIGKQATFTITAGSGTYTVESSDKEKATATIDKNTITISGVAEGAAKITVTDSKTKQTKEVDITVEVKTPDLAIDKDKVSLEEGKQATFAITAGSGTYTVESSDKEKATVTIAEGIITISGVAEGTAKITVTDSKTKQTKEVDVTVEAKIPNLAIDKDKITLEESKQATFAITAGSGTYTVDSSDKEKATATIDKNTITISGVAEGTAKITVTDSKTKQTKEVEVTITKAASKEIVVSVNKVSITVGNTAKIQVTIPKGMNIEAYSKDETLATVSVKGNTLYIKGEKETDNVQVIVHEKNNKANQKVIDVVVNKIVSGFSLTPYKMILKVEGDKTLLTIVSGSGNFKVTSKNEQVATVSKYSNTEYYVEPKEVGKTTIEVIDNEKPTIIKSIEVTVNYADLAIDKSNLNLIVGSQATVNVTKGSGKYTVSSSDEAKAKATVSGGVITVNGVAEGTAKITVTDSETGQTKVISIMVVADPGNSYMGITTNKNIGESIKLKIDAELADRAYVWIDLNNNGIKDSGEAVTNFNSYVNYTLASKTFKIYGKITGFYTFTNWQVVNGAWQPIGQKISSLDVSANTALRNLICGYNQLSSLDVSANTALKNLNCHNNQLSSLDVSANTALEILYCHNNQLSSLDVSANTALKYLECNGNQLSSLDVSASTELKSLYCYNNQLSSLDVSANTELKGLYCYNNQLSSLDVVSAKLETLYCYNNQLSSLDVSTNTRLTNLNCGKNQLISLDVSANTALRYLYCYNNQLISLDVSANTALKFFDCGYNQLSSLDVSANTALERLYCYNNQISSLDVSANTALQRLYCENNQITCIKVNATQLANIPGDWHKDNTASYNTTCP